MYFGYEFLNEEFETGGEWDANPFARTVTYAFTYPSDQPTPRLEFHAYSTYDQSHIDGSGRSGNLSLLSFNLCNGIISTATRK
jgi:hypothetical protein